jgi:hypothetical protein
MPAVTSATALAHSPSAQRLSVSLAAAGSKPGLGTQEFISAKRAAFQILVAKLRWPSTRWSDSFMSRPCAAMAASVKRKASAP